MWYLVIDVQDVKSLKSLRSFECEVLGVCVQGMRSLNSLGLVFQDLNLK